MPKVTPSQRLDALLTRHATYYGPESKLVATFLLERRPDGVERTISTVETFMDKLEMMLEDLQALEAELDEDYDEEDDEELGNPREQDPDDNLYE